MAGWSGDTTLGSRSRVRILKRTVFFSEKKELTSWWSVAILSTKNRRGGALGLAADLPARIVSSAFVE